MSYDSVKYANCSLLYTFTQTVSVTYFVHFLIETSYTLRIKHAQM